MFKKKARDYIDDMSIVFIWASAGSLKHWLKTTTLALPNEGTTEQKAAYQAERDRQDILHYNELRDLSKASVFHINFKEWGDNETAFAIAVADTSDSELQFYYDRLPQAQKDSYSFESLKAFARSK